MDADKALAMVQRLYKRLAARRPEIDMLEDYKAGKQPLKFATPEWRDAHSARYTGFADNWCRAVVDAESERIRHTGLKIADNSEAAHTLHQQWLRNEMEMQSSQGFDTTLTAKRSYVIVWGSANNEPIISWEHPSQVEIEYDWGFNRHRIAALKTWADDTTEYATLFDPEAVWKFQRPRQNAANADKSQSDQARQQNAASGGWIPYQPDDVWPLRNPMGVVPVVEFANRPPLAGDPISEITPVIGLQDSINLLWAYLFVAADYASMPARVVTGQGAPKIELHDANGKSIGEKKIDIKTLSTQRLMYLQNPDAKIDSWEAARMDVFTDVIDVAVGHIASQTRTPPTYLVSKTGMSNVNGQGIQASEIGLVKKTLEFQSFASPALREVNRLIALAMGDNALAALTSIATITWANPEIRSEAQLADALLKKRQMGYPLEYIMELDGLDPLQVERVLAMAEAEKFDSQLAAANRDLTNIANPSSGQ